ncbi:MAG: cation:proton antiporter [Candidatus Delongbacteria bacterium]
METLNSHQVLVMLLSFGVLLGLARVLGELALKLHQPAVLGELLAGVLLGPTLLGALDPGLQTWLFPASGPNALALSAVSTLAIVLFLLVAGLEVDLSILARQGRVAPLVGLTGIVIPFGLGLGLAGLWPSLLTSPMDQPLLTAMFFATALSISALPVIAKTLLDLGLYRSDLGMLSISAAILNDLVGWLLFAFILGLLPGAHAQQGSIWSTALLTVLTVAFMLTAGRWMVHRSLPWVQAYSRWPAGELSFALILALFAGALTEWIGVHAIFGSFLAGVAIGDSSHLRERTRVIIDQFVSVIFAPLFFAGIGLMVDFGTQFDFKLTGIVLLVACVGKLAGGYLGSRWGGLPSRDAWAVGFALNARGGMVIILGVPALQAGLIDATLFVALVVTALVTSAMSGPFMRLLIRQSHAPRLADLLGARHFLPNMAATTRQEGIAELCSVAARAAGLVQGQLCEVVWSREQSMPTGLGNRIAVPHARMEGLSRPLVVLGRAHQGLDFDAPDGKPAQILILLLTPKNDAGVQLSILSELAHLFHGEEQVDRMLKAQTYTEVIALLRSRPQQAGWV